VGPRNQVWGLECPPPRGRAILREGISRPIIIGNMQRDPKLFGRWQQRCSLLYQYCSSLYCRRLQMSRWLFLPACFGTATTSLRETSRQGKASTGRGLTLPASSYRASYLATFCSPILHSERRLCLHQLLQGYKSGDRPEPSRLTGRGLLWSGSGVSSSILPHSDWSTRYVRHTASERVCRFIQRIIVKNP